MVTSRARTPTLVGLAVLLVSSLVTWLLPVGVRVAAAGEITSVDAKAQARVKLVEGGELLKQGEYTEALARFKSAYELVPSPKIFYNFGLAYTNLGRTTEAVESFEKFLDEATDASPELRANAERYKSQLVPKIASVVVQSDADGAEISVDGRPYGTTPRKNPIRLDPGVHSLVVEKSPRPAFTRKIEALAGQRLVVDVTLGSEPTPLAATPLVPIVAPPPPGPIAPLDQTPPWGWKKKAALGSGVAALAALAFGIVEQLGASSKYEKFNNYAAPNPLGKCDADARVLPPKGGGDCASLLSSADSASVLAKVGLIGGGVLAASSITLFVLSRREPRDTASSRASLGCVPMGQGMSCAFRF